MSQPLVFYDILMDATRKDRQTWSANSWKTRMALNYKRIPYTTVWVEYADIQAAGKEISAKLTDTGSTGASEPIYTLPAIRNPATGEAIADSDEIIAYLEETYPERQLIPAGTFEQQITFSNQILGIIGMEVLAFVTNVDHSAMSPRSAAAFERFIRSVDHGPPFAERPPPPPEAWARVQEGFSRLAQKYGPHKYVFGEHISYGDFAVAALLFCFYPSLTDEKKADVHAWDGGRWKALMADFEEAGYVATDHGEIYATSAQSAHS